MFAHHFCQVTKISPAFPKYTYNIHNHSNLILLSKFPLNSNKFKRVFFLWKLKSNVAIVCSYNLLILFVGEYMCEHNTIRKVCQEFQKIPAYNFTSNSSSVVVKFFSDSSVNRRGFLLRYRYVEKVRQLFFLQNFDFESDAALL